MSLLGLLEYFYLSRFSQPAKDRVLFRVIGRQRVLRIVELGIGDAGRARRMIRFARRRRPGEEIFYTGVDLFEGKESGEGTPFFLKDAYRLLHATGAKIRLTPGDPFSALSRIANLSTGIDLLLVSKDQNQDALSRAWYFVPRMLHPGSYVLVEQDAGGGAESCWKRLSPQELEAAASLRRWRKAG